MKKSYAIVLALFCFGLMSSTVDELGIFDQSIVDVGITTDYTDNMMTETDKIVTVNKVEDSSIISDIFSVGKGLAIGLGILWGAVGKTLVIYGTLVTYGVHTSIAAMIQGMVTLVEAIALVEFALARRASQ